MPSNHLADIATKEEKRLQFAALTEQFLAAGGQIEAVGTQQREPLLPPGVADRAKQMTKARIKRDDSIRAEVIQRFNYGYRTQRICDDLGITRAVAIRILDSAGLNHNRNAQIRLSDEQLDLLHEFSSAGMSKQDMARLIGLPVGRVTNYLDLLGLAFDPQKSQQPLAVRELEMPSWCNKCGKPRHVGNHDKCSRQRQLERQQREAQHAPDVLD